MALAKSEKQVFLIAAIFLAVAVILGRGYIAIADKG